MENRKTTKKILKMEKKHGREIDRRERLPTVNRKLARPAKLPCKENHESKAILGWSHKTARAWKKIIV